MISKIVYNHRHFFVETTIETTIRHTHTPTQLFLPNFQFFVNSLIVKLSFLNYYYKIELNSPPFEPNISSRAFKINIPLSCPPQLVELQTETPFLL